MGVIRYKIWSDLWANKGRTLQVVLIIAMGAFAIGLIIATRMLVIGGMEDMWRACSPAMIVLWTNPSVDDDTIMALKKIEGLEEVEGYTSVSIEWRLNPDDKWLPATLIARDDYKNQHYTKVNLLSGEWPQKKVFAVGQGGDIAFGIEEGGQVTIRVDDREHLVEIGGVIYDPVAFPPSFGGPAQFFTTRDRIDYLTGNRDFNRILAGTSEYDEAVVTDLASQMQDKLEKQGVDSGGASPMGGRTSDPDEHFFQEPLDGIFFLMGIMAVLALILGLFLVYNTINAILTQQIDQIGVMKAIGARTGQILRLYLTTVFIYGFLALLIAVPLGAIGAWGLNVFLMGSFNADPGSFSISPLAIQAQVAIALLAPLLASLIPLFSGVGITVREAISTYGLSAGSGLLERLLAKLRFIPRLLSLTISNTFRHKRRVFLTQITLVLSGLIFMMVMSVRDSAAYTFGDVLLSILRFDVTLAFEEPERTNRVELLTRLADRLTPRGLQESESASQVEALTLAHPQVKAVEMWNLSNAKIRPADQPESDDDEGATMFGVPLPTTLYGPQMRAGRWLQPDDRYAAVLNQKLAEDVGVGAGDWVTFDHGVKGESDWLVVGLLFDPIITNSAHVPRDVISKVLRRVNKANTVWIQTVRDDPAGDVAIARSLREYYDEHQLDVSAGGTFGGIGDTASEIADNILGRWAFIITLLATMAVVIGIVGSIALSGVLSLGVLERRREIGVMRAIGASSGAIARLFIGEGLILGLLSWVIAWPLSAPAGRLMMQGLAAALGGELVYRYTPTGPLYWLGIITVLSIVASWFPARGATRISVRESLAYE
jgi:putative ABC transport system permease protein